jgi:hypothetical protein
MIAPLPEPRVREILAAYGADPARWPQAEREAARVAIAASPALARAQEAERRADGLLALIPDPSPSAAFLGKALAGAPTRARAPGLSPWMLAGATAAVLVVAVSASWQIQRDAMMRDADEAVELLITDIGDHS